MKYKATVYTAGYNAAKDMHLFDQYKASEILSSELGNRIQELIDSAESDGQTIIDIVVTKL